MPKSGWFVWSRNMIFPFLVMNIKLISQPLNPLQLRDGQSYVLFANSTYSPVIMCRWREGRLQEKTRSSNMMEQLHCITYSSVTNCGWWIDQGKRTNSKNAIFPNSMFSKSHVYPFMLPFSTLVCFDLGNCQTSFDKLHDIAAALLSVLLNLCSSLFFLDLWSESSEFP